MADWTLELDFNVADMLHIERIKNAVSAFAGPIRVIGEGCYCAVFRVGY